MAILCSKQVSLQLDNKLILNDVSLEAYKGDFIGLIGPNGSGKSTWLRAICGLLPYKTGKIKVENKEIRNYDTRELAKIISYVPQDISLDFDFLVRDIVLMGRHAHIPRFGIESANDYEIAEQAMIKTNIEDLADRYVNQLSGGQRQMVFIAKALAQDTDVLILDEPTSALDINRQLQVLELVKELTEERVTVITAIHDLNLAARFCNQLVLLEEGKVIASGPPSKVLTTNHILSSYQVETAVRYDSLVDAHYVTPLSYE